MLFIAEICKDDIDTADYFVSIIEKNSVALFFLRGMIFSMLALFRTSEKRNSALLGSSSFCFAAGTLSWCHGTYIPLTHPSTEKIILAMKHYTKALINQKKRK